MSLMMGLIRETWGSLSSSKDGRGQCGVLDWAFALLWAPFTLWNMDGPTVIDGEGTRWLRGGRGVMR